MDTTRRAFLQQAAVVGAVGLIPACAKAANPLEKTHMEWVDCLGTPPSCLLRPQTSDSRFCVMLIRLGVESWEVNCENFTKQFTCPDVFAAKAVAQEFTLQVLRNLERAIAAMGAA